MITHYPATAEVAPPIFPARAIDSPVSTPESGSWRYSSRPLSRPAIVSAMLVSAGLHAGLLLGFGHQRPKAVTTAAPEHTIALVPMPQIKELEDPEPVPVDDTAPALDLATLVPMQQDLPQLPRPNDFVQAINFASLLEQPDFSKVQVYTIPQHMRSAGNIAAKIGKIFELADLDRIPDPLFQPPPVYPQALRREGVTATVRIEFVVDPNGHVLNAVVVETTEARFNDAAITGVSKWRFKPGMKNGRKVNTRMAVPIVFKMAEPID